MKYGATKPANMQLTRHKRTAEAINKVAGTMRPLLIAKSVPLKGPVPTTRARYGALIDAGDPLVGGAGAACGQP
ncbi:hypothetical protein LA080_013040 [Diaporthe eres]|nr:hypothetical protein LA080_013040 [Diaporthe eres]